MAEPQAVFFAEHFLAPSVQFNLPDLPLKGDILLVGFAATTAAIDLAAKGQSVLAYDPCYQMDADSLAKVLQQDFAKQAEHFQLDQEEKNRCQVAMERFLEDFRQDSQKQRYIGDGFGRLLSECDNFSLALVSHFLFGYRAEMQNLQDELTLVNRLVKSAEDVQIYPLTNAKGESSEHTGPLMLALQQQGFRLEITENAVLQVCATRCAVD